MKEYRILNIIDTSMEDTNQRVAVVELSEIEYLNPINGFTPQFFQPKGKRFVIDFYSHLTNLIINAAQKIESINIDLKEFREKNEIKNGFFETIYYHRNVYLLGLDDDLTTRDIDYNILCKNCKTERNFTSPFTFPSDIFLNLTRFKEVLLQIDIDCLFCGNSGYAGDINKFDLVSTSGLDEDLKPIISNDDKRNWYSNLDFVFQYYLKEIFEINEYTQIGFSLDFYECRFVLNKQTEFSNKDSQYGFYLTKAVLLGNGDVHPVLNDFPFIYKVNPNQHLKDEIIINPHRYSAIEKPLKTSTGNIFFPFLELR